MTKREFMQALSVAYVRAGGAFGGYHAKDISESAEQVWDAIESRLLERYPGETTEEFKKRTEVNK